MKHRTLSSLNLRDMLALGAHFRREVLVPAEEQLNHLAEAKGWLDQRDDFFAIMERIVQGRSRHLPRLLTEQPRD